MTFEFLPFLPSGRNPFFQDGKNHPLEETANPEPNPRRKIKRKA